MTFYLVGDSHIGAFQSLANRNEPPRFIVHTLGAHTAFKLVSYDRTSKSYPKLERFLSAVNRKEDVVMLCFGEIDCRIHLYYQSKKQKEPIWTLLKTTIFRYLGTIIELKLQGFNVGVIGIAPASRQKNYYKYKHYADDVTRAKISHSFNNMLDGCCKTISVPYFNVFNFGLTDHLGMIKPELTLRGDLVHIDPSKYPIIEKFKKWVNGQWELT